MNNFFNKVNKSISIFIIIFLILSFGISVFSYYLQMLNLNFNQSIVSIDLLFDKLSTVGDDTSPLAVYQKTLNENAVYNPDASWGSEENPYIISHPKHLENLSVLQNNGYFYTNYIQKNFDNGVYNNNTIMPHFLISTTEGTPVTIDCMGIELS